MRIRRRADGRGGCAFQFVGRWTLDGEAQAAGTWLLEVEGSICRFSASTARLQENYKLADGDEWPPSCRSFAP